MDDMRLLNPRLLQQAGSARGYLAVTVALGLAGAAARRTMLLITHDLDGLDELDQVITLEKREDR